MDYIDLLARLGVASAHPGGFRATKTLLAGIPDSSGLRILEVGCGTGKSACYLAQKGYQVVALDRHPLMLERAKERAEREDIEGIHWVEGDAEALPFEDESFDLVLAESVTLFTDIPRTLREYYRVLKPNGRLLDREIVRAAAIPEPVYKELASYFRFRSIPSLDQWLTFLHETGFRCDRPVLEDFVDQEPPVLPEDMQELDLAALFDPEVGAGLAEYTELMMTQQSFLRACSFSATK
ncbi:putative methyltransferase YodH [Paenibacillus sp. J31TS4]|uniref:class I SAM-dependent methyltransferase n=1 Tax=Paenibacillus sp. J31TS4 TaxID=2807195 RepID=UPI001B0ECBB9|nr:class I SAM-dependent methyltransferase [Paenibacillus sp. J31TS4]GIP40232.1 putative methyltransferase YodH [Paenibacillus sp. J31TS4]